MLLLLPLALFHPVSAHFVLQVPTSLGFDDALEGAGPCGSFDITDRHTVTPWPLAGGPVQVISTHPKADWTISAALLNSTGSFRPMVPQIRQAGLGTFCLPAVPGIPDWEGQDAVLQMIQNAADGLLYQVFNTEEKEKGGNPWLRLRIRVLIYKVCRNQTRVWFGGCRAWNMQELDRDQCRLYRVLVFVVFNVVFNIVFGLGSYSTISSNKHRNGLSTAAQDNTFVLGAGPRIKQPVLSSSGLLAVSQLLRLFVQHYHVRGHAHSAAHAECAEVGMAPGHTQLRCI